MSRRRAVTRVNHLHIRKLLPFDMQLGPDTVLAVGLEAEPVAFGDERGGCVGEGFHFADDVPVDVFLPVGDVVEEEHGRGGWWCIDDRGTDELIDDVHIAAVGGFVCGDRTYGGNVDITGNDGDSAVRGMGKAEQAVYESHSFFFMWPAGPVVSHVVLKILRAGHKSEGGFDPLE